jgi:hypothetical protein
MNRLFREFRMQRLAALVATIALFSAAGAAQTITEDPVLAEYLARVAELNRDGRMLVQEHGKDYLIAEYQALIEAHPEYPKNIQLETEIGEIYEWDFSNRGEPPDVASAYAVYLGIIDRYDPSYEYTKLVYRRAADRAETLDPAAARELYSGMLEAYPDDPVVQVESLFRLGALAERDGDTSEARELLDMVLGYDTRNQPINPDQAERIETVQSQAASLLLALGIDPAASPEERIAALDAFLEDHPEFVDEHGDVVADFHDAMNRLKDRTPRDEVREAMAELQRLLAERQDARASVDAPAEGGTRARRMDTAAVAGESDDWPGGTSGAAPPPVDAITTSPSSSTRPTNAFTGFEPDAYSEEEREALSPETNRAAAMAAAVVCSLLAAGGLFALRKRLGL